MDDERKKNSEDKNSGVQSIEAGVSVAHVYAEKLEKYNYKKKQRAKKLRKHAAEDRKIGKSESNPQSRARQRARIKKETQRKVQNRSSKEAANQFGDISRKFVDKAEDLTGKFAEFITEHFEESFVVMVVMVLILVIGALFSSCGSALTGTSHVGVTTSYTSDDDDIYDVENDYREMEEILQEIIDNVETDNPGYDEYQYYLDNIGHNPYQLAAVLTVLYEQYKGNVVRATLSEIFERQYYLSFSSVTETRTDDDTGIQYEYKILKVTLVNRTLDTVIRGLGLSADQMARYEVLLETYGNKRYLFEEDIYSIVEPGRYGEYDVPPEALTNTRFSNMIREAEKYLGYPYVWGGSKPSTSFDCSGFVCWVINHSNNGWNVGRTTANGLLGRCTRVSASEAQPGDLIFFKGTYDVKGASHVGIYVGDGMMLHCGNPIQYTSINSNYWRKHFYTYGRINA